MTALTLGIDIGTTSTKAVIADASGQLLRDASSSYAYSTPHPGWVEQDPEDWWQAVSEVTRELLGKYPDAKHRIASVGASGQGVASVLLGASGQPLRPAMLWLDTRSALKCAELQSRCGDQIAEISGKSPAPYNVEPKLLWIKDNEPEIWAQVWKSFTTTAYINYRLTGRAVMNHSDGGILLGYDLARRTWSAECTGLMGIPLRFYSDLAPCREIIGSVTAEAAAATGLNQGIPVIAGGEDTSSAGLAMGVTSSETGQLSMGSASTVYVPISKPLTDPRLLAFPHVIDDLTLVGGSMVAGGTAMDWVAQATGEERISAPAPRFQALTNEASAVRPGSDGTIFLPYLSGELQPVNDGFARGVFFGLDLQKTRGHLVRAVMEGTAYAIEHNLGITRELGANVSRLVAVGGPARNRLWSQIIADVTGVPVRVMQERGGAALGDAILAASGAGMISSVDSMVRAHAAPGDCFTPIAENHARYRTLFEIYKELYPRLKDLFPRVARFSENQP